MTLPRRHLIALLLAIPAACGDAEPEQRRAFIAFLKERILDKPGVHVVQPTPEQTKAWGDYAKHYAIITGFNEALTRDVSQPMRDVATRGTITSIQALVDRRADLVEVQKGMAALAPLLDRHLAEAEAARAALRQPADLKPVFDAAFARDVSDPAKLIAEVIPVADASFKAALSLADYLTQHARDVKITGTLVQTQNPAIQKELTARLADLNEKGQRAVEAQRRVQAMIRGQ